MIAADLRFYGDRMRDPLRDKLVENLPMMPEDLSLFRGGLFYRTQTLAHLIEPGQWNLGRRVPLALAVSWLPLVIFTALSSRSDLMGLLKDYVVYSRMAIAVPVLLIGQVLLESRFRLIVSHLRESQLLRRQDLHKIDGMIATLKRSRDSALPEVIILVVIVAELALIWQSKVTTGPAWAVSRTGEAPYLTLTGWYYALVCVPLYQFLIGLGFWRWLLWSFFLFRLSRLDLNLVATHPDTHGGLGFLGLSAIGFIPIAVAISSVIGATWRSQILYSGIPLINFWIPSVALFAVIFVVALGPLAFFLPKLAGLRKRAMLAYGTLAQIQAADFHRRWILHRRDDEEFLTTSRVSTLTDLAISYENIRNMQPFPTDRGTLMTLAAAVLVPLAPAVLAEIPSTAILKGLFHAITSPI